MEGGKEAVEVVVEVEVVEIGEVVSKKFHFLRGNSESSAALCSELCAALCTHNCVRH